MRIPLTQGAYEAKSIIADAQRCLNLYPEKNPPDSPFPITHYQTPGLNFLTSAVENIVRCIYRASNGDLYTVVGQTVYYVSPSLVLTSLGSLSLVATTPVSMGDNGLAIVIVDGSTNGYAIDMTTRAFGTIISGSGFYGADRVDYVDTFFLLNRPGTNDWYISLAESTFEMLTAVPGSIDDGSLIGGTGYNNGSYPATPLTGGSGSGATADITISGGIVTLLTIVNKGSGYAVGDVLSANGIGAGTGFSYGVSSVGGAFDPLDIATKNGYPDPIASLIVMHREVWLIGTLTTEIWYNSGAADFTFQQMPGAFIEHGCIAKYSVAKQDLSVYWLSQDEQGQIIVMRGAAYVANRISTHAIENEFSKYSTVSDAIGFTYQQEGHVFYMLTFPTADKTWVYDQAAELWHERGWTDENGVIHRHRANCAANAYQKNIVGDWENGNLYAFSLDTYTDNGNPITRIRSFSHIVNESKRVVYNQFIADMDVGTDPNSTTNDSPQVSLRWSDDKGASYGNRLEQGLGSSGQYLTNIQWGRLGIARDRVFELSWSAPVDTSLNGAYVSTTSAGT